MEDVLKRKNIQVKNIFRGKVLWLKVTAVFVMFIPGFVIVVLSFAFLVLPSHAAIPQTVNYQGKLTDASNVAVTDGNYIMTFRLYTSATAATTTALWEEIRTATGDRAVVTSGLFSVLLGSSTPFTSVNFNQTLYLGVEVCGTTSLAGCDGEMTPRKALASVPSAFLADQLSGSILVNQATSTITNLTMVNATSTNATTTSLYASGSITVAGTATSSFASSLAVTEANATSTFAGGLDLADGCFALDGVCIGGGDGASNWTDGGIYLTPLTTTDGILIHAATSTITNTNVLSATTLGSAVVSPSLTGVGALAGGSTASGFGTIATGNTITGTTLNGTTGLNTGAGGGTNRLDVSGNLVNIGTISASGLATLTGGILVNN